MNSRELILDRLQKAAPSDYISQSIIKPVIMEPVNVDMFVEKANAAGAHVQIAADIEKARDILQQIISAHGYQLMVSSSEDIIKKLNLNQIASETGAKYLNTSSMDSNAYHPYVLKAEVGITSCDWAIADSGTVVIVHSSVNERLISLAPIHYVCIVETQHIVSNRFALVPFLMQMPELPSAFTFITGVSRTADVAMQVVLGMHGPRIVDIIVLGDYE